MKNLKKIVKSISYFFYFFIKNFLKQFINICPAHINKAIIKMINVSLILRSTGLEFGWRGSHNQQRNTYPKKKKTA